THTQISACALGYKGGFRQPTKFPASTFTDIHIHTTHSHSSLHTSSMMQTELIENNSHLAESFTAPQAVQSVPYATPVTPPPILQSQQPINHPVGPPPALNIPYQSNAAPNASIAPSNCCANCSESRQTGNPPPPVNVP